MPPLVLPSFLAACLLVAVHVLAHRLKFLDGVPRSRWLSAAGGMSLAYVFLHLLPELAEGQRVLMEEGLGLALIEFEIYGLALIGLVGYYGVERMVQLHGEVGRDDIREEPEHGDAAHASGGQRDAEAHEHPTFWVHLASFAFYNLIIGYLLLHRGGHGGGQGDGHEGEGGHGGGTSAAKGLAGSESDVGSLLVFALAMALHFLVTDYGLREDFRRGWMRTGRWVLSAAVVAGWLLGLVIELPEIAILGAIAILGGGVILNVLKEELPEERRSRFGALLAGVAGYTALLALAA